MPRGRRRLRLDAVVASQPELGPAAPDGGFGWCVLVCVAVLRITISSLLASYGVLLLWKNAQSKQVLNPSWDQYGVWMPFFFAAAWSLSDPWSNTLASVGHPQKIACAGVLLVAGGVMVTSLVPLEAQAVTSYFTQGLIAGAGASLAMTEGDTLLRKYFRVRLPMVLAILDACEAAGRLVMPIIAGLFLEQYGLSGTVLLLGSIALQSFIGIAFFQYPKYSNEVTDTEYCLLQNEEQKAEDEDHEDTVETSSENKNVPPNRINEAAFLREGADSTHFGATTTAIVPNDSFVPRPLFYDSELSGSGQELAFFVEDAADEDVTHYTYGDHLKRGYNCTKEMKSFIQASFYVALSVTAMNRIVSLALWLLFPFYSFSKVDGLGFLYATLLPGVLGVTDFLFLLFKISFDFCSSSWSNYGFSVLLFISASGLFIIHGSNTLPWLIGGAVISRFGVCGVNSLLDGELKSFTGAADYTKFRVLLDTFTGLILMMTTLSVKGDLDTWLSHLGWIQLGVASVWLLAQVFQKMCSYPR